MIEISGLPATLALLAPFVVLLLVAIRLGRMPADGAAATDRIAPQPLRAIPAGEALAREPAEAVEPAAAFGTGPQPDWPERFARAEADGDHRALADLHLAYARAELAAGRAASAADHLRSCLRAGARIRDRRVQAEARLELAELARAAGDLTTACEHWQIARGLFHGLADEARLGDTERLMRRHGCPTDWVLNDF